MRIRYQASPKVAVFGMILSLGLIFGAHETMSAAATVQETEAPKANIVEPIGVGVVNLVPEDVEEVPALQNC